MLLFGLLGEKLTHSLSPEIHNAVLKSLGVKATYSLFEVEKQNVPNVINSIKTLGITGINVTIPYKETIMEYLDFISEEAKNINAVNTVFIKDGKSYGFNTDYYGFGKMLERSQVSVEGKKVVVLGSGGASKAVIQYLKDNKAEQVFVVSRDKAKVAGIFTGVTLIDYEELKSLKGDIIINTTPVGMYPNIDAMPVGEDVLENFNTAADIVYNPLKTKFLATAESLGLKIVTGLFMLVEQAIKSEEIWHNTVIDEKIGKEIHNELCKLF